MFIAGSVPAILLAFVCLLLRVVSFPDWSATGLYALGVLAFTLLIARGLVVQLRSVELNVEVSLVLAGLVLFAPVVWYGATHPQ